MNNERVLILIVDDDNENIKILGNILETHGLEIAVAMNGNQALNFLEHETPDIILLDIMMPGIDGYEVCKKIKKHNKTKDIPVIFMTALSQTEDIVKGFQVGGVDYLTKPLRLEEVVARVETHIKICRQNKKLKMLNATKNKFFSIIAHDIRNPLSAIHEFSKMLIHEDEKLTVPKDELFTLIANSTAKLLDLVADVSKWAKSQDDEIVMHHDTIHIDALLRDSIDLLLEQAKNKNIELIPRLIDSTLIGDHYMLDTVFRNLISNAIKFTPKNGIIEINNEENEEYIVIHIKDNGVGINKKHMQHLFQVGKKMSTTGTNGEHGTGLGLILCKNFIEKHKGKLEIESEINVGSTFSVYLPKNSTDMAE